MSIIKNRYFKTSFSSPLGVMLSAILKEERAARAAIHPLQKEYGFSKAYGSGVDAMRFDFDRADSVDPKVWAKTRPMRGTYYFVPNKRTAEGKALREKLKAVPEFRSLHACLEAVKLHWRFPCLIDEDSYGHRPVLRYLNKDKDVIIILVPWRDVPKKEMDQYKRDNKKGIYMSAELDYLQWEAPDFLTEIKEWEALKIIEGD